MSRRVILAALFACASSVASAQPATPCAPGSGVWSITANSAVLWVCAINGQSWVAVGGGGGGSVDTVLRLAGDVSTGPDVNLVDLSGMAFTADAGGIYKIDIVGDTQAAAATTGFGIGLNCAQSPVKVVVTGYSQLANIGTSTAWSAIANNAIIGVTSGRPSANTVTPMHGGGLLVAHATVTGTCTFRLRSETTAVVTVKANSMFVVRKVN